MRKHEIQTRSLSTPTVGRRGASNASRIAAANLEVNITQHRAVCTIFDRFVNAVISSGPVDFIDTQPLPEAEGDDFVPLACLQNKNESLIDFATRTANGFRIGRSA